MARVDEVGGYVKLTLTGVDLSTATTKQIVMLRSNGTRKAAAASFFTNGSDGVLIYYFIAGDLTCSGTWKFQIKAVFPDGSIHYSSIYTDAIDENI